MNHRPGAIALTVLGAALWVSPLLILWHFLWWFYDSDVLVVSVVVICTPMLGVALGLAAMSPRGPGGRWFGAALGALLAVVLLVMGGSFFTLCLLLSGF